MMENLALQINRVWTTIIKFSTRQKSHIPANGIQVLQEVIQSLHDNEYTAFIMYFEGYTHQQIADQLQQSIKEVKKNISQAHRQLKCHLLIRYDLTFTNKSSNWAA